MKLFLKGDKCMTPKCPVERRNTRPGQHGSGRQRKLSGMGLQLREKQKVRRTYGVLERQFRRYFNMALSRPGKTGENLLQLLVMHGHFQVNGRKLDIPSAVLKPGDEIGVRERSKNLEYFKTRALMLNQRGVPPWLHLEPTTLAGRVLAVPTRQDLEVPFDEALVVEYYQR
jgi:small subunit ribosomal protein S4